MNDADLSALLGLVIWLAWCAWLLVVGAAALKYLGS